MNFILIWLLRVLLYFLLVVSGTSIHLTYKRFESLSYLAKSAPQATQLSNEFILQSLSGIGYLVVITVFIIAVEINFNTYKRMKS